MFCGNCGTKLNEGAAFCPNCGTPVSAESVPSAQEVRKPEETPAAPAESAAPVPEVQKLEETAPTPAAAPAENAAPVPETQKPERKKAGNKGAIIVLAVILLLVIGAGAGAAIYFTSDGYNIKKNLKQAQQCFAEQEYEDALSYYEEALDLDDTLVDAYLKSAEIYVLQDEYENAIELLIKGRKRTGELEEAEPLLRDKLAEVYQAAADYYAGQGNYNQAYALLKEGIEELGGSVQEADQEELYLVAALTAKLEELYLAEAEKYLAEGNYYMARDVLKTGASAAESHTLFERLVETYSSEAEQYLEQKSYYDALWALNDGALATGDDSLSAKKTEVYARWSDDYLSQEYYQDALWVLNDGLEATGDVSLEERKVVVYTQWAESYKEAGDYAGAFELLDEGLEATGDASLTEQKTHLQEHLELVKATAYSGSRIQLELEFDEAGNPTKSFSYSYGNLSDGEEMEYDASGKLVTRKVYSDGVLSYIITYDEKENPKDQTWYDRYGEATNYETATAEYDDTGKVTWIIWSGEANNKTEQMEYLYDGAGNLTGIRRYGHDGTLLSETGYTGEALTTIITYNSDGSIERQTEYTYVTIDSGTLLYPASIITYDGEGNVDSWLKHEYEFDAMGNAAVDTCYYGYSYNYDETLSNGYYNYQWTYTNEYRYTGE